MIDSWEKLTIGKYQELTAILNKGGEEIEMKTEIISLLTDMDIDDVYDLPLPTYHRLLQSIGFLFEEIPHRQVLRKYNLGGIEFEVLMSIEKMTAGQFIDYQTFIKDPQKYLVELLSIFFIPKGHKYNDGYDMVEVQKAIRENLSIVDGHSLAAFFLLWYRSLLKVTVNYLTKKMKKMMRKEKNKEVKAKMEEMIMNLELSGDGLLSLTELQKQ